MPNILYVILEQNFIPAMFIETISFLLTLVTAAAVECEYSYRTEWLVLELPLLFIVCNKQPDRIHLELNNVM